MPSLPALPRVALSALLAVVLAVLALPLSAFAETQVYGPTVWGPYTTSVPAQVATVTVNPNWSLMEARVSNYTLNSGNPAASINIACTSNGGALIHWYNATGNVGTGVFQWGNPDPGNCSQIQLWGRNVNNTGSVTYTVSIWDETPAPTNTPTPVPTNTPTPLPTNTPTNTPLPTNTPTPGPSSTPAPATPTPAPVVPVRIAGSDPPLPFRFAINNDGTYSWNVSLVTRGTLADCSGSIATANTSQQAAAANPTRHYLLVQNNTAADLWLNFAVAAVTGQPSMKLASGALLTFNRVVPTDALAIVGATAGTAYTCKEG